MIANHDQALPNLPPDPNLDRPHTPSRRSPTPITQPAGDVQAIDAQAKEQQRQLTKDERRLFQSQELTTARPFSFVFNSGDPPRIVWRDVDEVRRLGADGKLNIRWFDANLNEVETPTQPGRWGAYVEGLAPNGTPLRRALTFYCRPEGFLFLFADENVPPPQQPAPITPGVWSEHQAEVSRVSKDLFFRSLNDSEAGAILLAGLSECDALGRPPLSTESAAVRNDDYHMALKIKVLGLHERVRQLKQPRIRPAGPALVLREGSPAEAGVLPGAKDTIDAVLKAWAEDSGEPFVTLVARHGVIITHEPFGRDKNDQPITLDYRCPVFSITKTITAMLFSQFLDQGLIGLDDSVGTVFPDYPRNSPHVPTFRQCLTHTSGLTGHGDWGGVRNPHLDNIILNGIDANEPGKAYAYSGMGFDLTAEAMELTTAKSALHLYRDHLFVPLGLGDVPMTEASSGAQLTAANLGVLAQWLANRGSYGELEFISPQTFDLLLPEPLERRHPGISQVEGIGMHWMKDLKPGAAPHSDQPEDLIFSTHTIGHGSLSSSILRVDLNTGLIIVQVRKEAGRRFGEWAPKLFQAAADSIVPDNAAPKTP